jgi:parallel beta-helix repeat protein
VLTRLALISSAVVAAGVCAGSSGAVAKATVTCGDTISSPGIYSLAGDCTGGGITILSDNVTLQLMGHKMTAGFCCPYGIYVSSHSHVLVKGPGTILGYGYDVGVYVEYSSDVRVDGLTVAESSIGIDVYLSNNVAVTHNVIGPTQFGVGVYGSGGSTVEWNKVVDSLFGIYPSYGSSNDNVVDNTVTSNYDGILVDYGASGNRIFANNAKGNFNYDLYDANGGCDSNQWLRNGFNTRNQSCIH